MLRLAAVAMVAASMAMAGPTTVAQSKITAGNGRDLASGTITITATVAFAAADGAWVDTQPLTVPVINGAISIQLEPTDTATPSGVSYRVRWQLDNAQGRTEYWVVPTSNTALGLTAVRVNVVPAPNLVVDPKQIGQDGAGAGQAMCWLGSQWGPGNCGAAVTKTWGSLLGTTWGALIGQ